MMGLQCKIPGWGWVAPDGEGGSSTALLPLSSTASSIKPGSAFTPVRVVEKDQESALFVIYAARSLLISY